MKQKIILAGGIKERNDIRSGRIYQEGKEPEYGVIFTANQDLSDNDIGLNPEDLEGAFIGSVRADENQKDKFFEILGGYYYQDNYPDEPKTTKVFGVAKSVFGVTEGGSSDLSDAGWKLQDPDKPYLAEDHWSRNYGKHHGWTFVVTVKAREEYPKSDEELKIFVEEEEVPCPEITLEKQTISKDENNETVKFTVNVSGALSEKYEWDCGDGTNLTTTEPTLTHVYKLPDSGIQEFKVIVKAIGPGECEDSAQITIKIERPPKPCPELTSLEYEGVDKDEDTQTFKFALTFSGDNPEKYEWDFGDGTNLTTTEPTSPHTYKLPDSGIQEFTVTVNAIGPGECKDSAQITVKIERPVKPCPELLSLEYEEVDKDANTQTFKFTLTVSGDNPEKYEWDFGDGTNLTTTEPTSPHTYQRPDGGTQEFTITVNATGPKECSASKETSVKLTALPVECPTITMEKQTTNKDQNSETIKFQVIVTGAQPDSFEWDCGDGTHLKTIEATTSHDYKLPASGTQKFHVCVKAIGPGTCEDSAETTVEIERPAEPCPEVTKFEAVEVTSDETTQTFDFTLNMSGKSPDKYEWDFGNGQTQSTEQPKVSHKYVRPASGSKSYKVIVRSVGPENCAALAETSVTLTARIIKDKKECWFWPLIVAFLMAMTFCTWLVDCVESSYLQEMEANNWLVPTTIVFAVFTIIAIFLWLRTKCPKGKKKWLGIVAVTALSGFLSGFYMAEYITLWFWVINFIMLGLAGTMFFFFKKCGGTTIEIIQRIGVGILVFIIVSIFIMGNVFAVYSG